jgi:hypothetical protein
MTKEWDELVQQRMLDIAKDKLKDKPVLEERVRQLEELTLNLQHRVDDLEGLNNE